MDDKQVIINTDKTPDMQPHKSHREGQPAQDSDKYTNILNSDTIVPKENIQKEGD